MLTRNLLLDILDHSQPITGSISHWNPSTAQDHGPTPCYDFSGYGNFYLDVATCWINACWANAYECALASAFYGTTASFYFNLR
jgi:hypothetical protein